MDMSHEATQEAAFTISSRHAGRRRRVRGCRIVIQVPVSATQGANRAAIKRISDYKAHGLFLDRPRRREVAETILIQAMASAATARAGAPSATVTAGLVRVLDESI